MRLSSLAFLPCAALLATAIPAQNLLMNPGFENTGAGGLAGWIVFGPNVTGEASNPPSIVPESGNGLCKMFGHFNNMFNVSGVYQTFAAQPGQGFTMACSSRHWSGDPLIGGGAPNDNSAVMKIAFFDANNVEIGSVERVILDGTFAQDVWINNAPITGVSPFGTVRAEAFILFLQPAMDGGSGLFDNVSFTPVNSQASYGGTGEDLLLATAVGGGPLSTGPSNEVKTAPGGSLLEFNVSSPGGTFDLQGYWLVGDLFSTGTPPSPLPQFPELWFSPSSYFLLVSGIPTPIGSPVILPNAGSSTYIVAPINLGGVSIIVQGLVVSSSVANNIYAATDAHEIQLQ